MGKPRKQKRHLKFDYNKNRKLIRKKEKRLPDIKCVDIKENWDNRKSMSYNLREMGLSANVNKTIKFPAQRTSRRGQIEEVMEVETEKTPTKKFVADGLEEKSNIPYKKKMTMSEEEAGLCVYMMDKHVDDYKAMARDRRNHYQETPKQIKKKIDRFKSIPEMYEIYAEARQGESSVSSSS